MTQGALAQMLEQNIPPQKPEAGPLGGAPVQGYNGIVKVEGEPVEVINGLAKFQGETFFVSNDGSIVIDKDHQIVGRIVDGVFYETDDDHIGELGKKGFIEGG